MHTKIHSTKCIKNVNQCLKKIILLLNTFFMGKSRYFLTVEEQLGPPIMTFRPYTKSAKLLNDKVL